MTFDSQSQSSLFYKVDESMGGVPLFFNDHTLKKDSIDESAFA